MNTMLGMLQKKIICNSDKQFIAKASVQ